ncbi:MAG: MMPL family transporter [Termitinemataceae bacterium]|nr:MAG: MMPL family transporter [Termitinemataceae bacterium]
MNKIYKHPWLIIAAIGIITLFFAVQLPRIQMDNNNLRFVPTDDDARLTSAWIEDTFGSSLFVLIGLERKYGTVLDADFLKSIKAFDEDIRQIETVDDVNSIMDTDYITGDADSVVVENLVRDDFLGTPAEIAELKQRLLSWNMYDRSLVSDDFKSTQIYVSLLIEGENAGNPESIASFLKIRDKAQAAFKDTATVYVTGMPVISGTLSESMGKDLRSLIPIVIIVVILVVWLPLRNFTFVFLSLLSVFLATVWTMGAMPLFGVRMSIITSVLPVILIAVGNSYGLHVIIHYIELSKKDFASMDRKKHTGYVISLMKIVRKPIFLAAITTLASFLSFCVTKVMPIREFGYFSAFGVFAALVLSLTLTPALLLIRGPKALSGLQHASEHKSEHQNRSFSDMLSYALVYIVKKRTVILTTAIVAVLVAIYGSSKLVTDNIFVAYFKNTSDIAKSDRFIRDNFGGSKTISIVMQADTYEELLHPDSLIAADKLNNYLLDNVPSVGKIMGFTDLIKRVNQVFNANESPDGIPPKEIKNEQAEDNFVFGFGFDSVPPLSAKKESPVAAKPKVDKNILLDQTDLVAMLDKAASVQKRLDANDLVWELKKAINYEGASYYEIPYDPARYGKQTKEDLQRLVSNYLVLLAGNSSSYSNDPLEPTAIKSTVQLRTLGQIDTDAVVQKINQFVQDNIPPNIKVTIGGTALVEGSTNIRVVQSVWSSVIIAFISLFFIVSYFNRSFWAGLIGVLPLMTLILLNFAVMGFLGIKLNIATAMIASVTMGIGIDYTIHIMEAYRRAYRENSGKGDFLFSAYRTSGIAIITDAVSTAAGFAVLFFSQFVILAEFGLLVTISLLASALVGLILIPMLLDWIKPKFAVG